MITENLIKNFQKIDKEQKIVKLQNILSIIKNTLPIFEDIAMHIQTAWNAIEDKTLVMYYTIILKNAEYLATNKIGEYKEFMQKLIQRENEDQSKNEINLDNELNAI